MSAPLLEVSSLQKRFQGILALDDVTFSLDQGRITSLIGPNGAGKTTMFNCVTGMYTPSEGTIRFDGEDIAGLGAHRISRYGVARTFQNLALFGGLKVLQNLMAGAYLQGSAGLLQGALGTPRARREQREAEKAGCEALAFRGMEDAAQSMPSELLTAGRSRSSSATHSCRRTLDAAR